MKKHYIIFILSISLLNSLNAQLDQKALGDFFYYTALTYDNLSFNPAYAGSMKVLDVRAYQWNTTENWKGFPEEISISGSSILKGNKTGVGLRIAYDQEFFYDNWEVTGYLAYHHKIKEKIGLSVGLSPSVKLRKNLSVPVNASVPVPHTETRPNLGLGFLLSYSDNLQVGLSFPKVFNQSFLNPFGGEVFDIRRTVLTFNYAQHLTSAQTFQIFINGMLDNSDWLSAQQNSYIPTSTRLSLGTGLFIYHAIQFGGYFHTKARNGLDLEGLEFWSTYFFRNGINIGASVQMPKSDDFNIQSFNVLLAYTFDYYPSVIRPMQDYYF